MEFKYYCHFDSIWPMRSSVLLVYFLAVENIHKKFALYFYKDELTYADYSHSLYTFIGLSKM